MQIKNLFLFLILISIFSCNRYVKQDRFVFKDYNVIIKDLNEKGKASEYYKNLNYEAMICLDTNCISTFRKINPGFMKEKIDSSFMQKVEFINNSWTMEMHVDFESMEYLFTDPDIINRMCSHIYKNAISYNNIDSTIYIKDDNIAYISHHFAGGVENYRMKIIKNQLKFQLVDEKQK